MVKALSFKGDPKPKKRKRQAEHDDSDQARNANGHTHPPATTTEPIEEDTAWTCAETTNDISGPTVLVFDSHTARSSTTSTDADHDDDNDDDKAKRIYCLATDAQGSVYPSLIENHLDHNPFTSEPHDVRQVWIPTRIDTASTTTGPDAPSVKIAFKSHHGKYLSCDKFGILSCTRDAISALETFECALVSSPENAGSDTQAERDLFILRTAVGQIGLDHTDKIAVRGDLASEHGKTDLNSVTPATGSSSSGIEHATPTTASQVSALIVRVQAKYKTRTQVAKSSRASEKISRSQLQLDAGGVRLSDEQVRLLRRAKKAGTYYEAMLDVRAKGSHDKYA